MLKEFLRKIPYLAFLYRCIRKAISNAVRQCKNMVRWFIRQCKNIVRWFIRQCKNIVRWIIGNLQKKKRRNFEIAIEKWSFNHAFSDLVKCAEFDHDYLEETGKRLIKEDRTNPKGYALIQACLVHKPKEGHYDVGAHSLAIGSELVNQGKLKEARAYFLSLQKIFPEIYEPYAILYDIIYVKQEEYRAAPNPEIHGGKKPILFSFSIWGDKYISFFNNYCIPSMIAEGNFPSVAKIRDISVDIYAHHEDILKIRNQDMFESFSKLCTINFIEFPKRLITCEGYKKLNASFRYCIYGGFHHLSIERARTLGADVVCLGPDNLHSNGSFLNYVKYIDEGYSAVLFTSTRAQAEFLLPVLDTMKDPATKALPITPDEMVEFSARYIHHSFLQYIVTDNITGVWRSAFFIPYKHGFYIRSFHYHPVIISAAAIDRSKDIHWNYSTADALLITMLFPDKKDWEKIKLITDSREGIMLDVAYGSPGLHSQSTTEFSEEYLNKISGYFNENEHWNFKFTIDYRMEKESRGVRAYLYDKDGTLQPHEFPLTTTIEDIKKRIDDWYKGRASADPLRANKTGTE